LGGGGGGGRRDYHLTIHRPRMHCVVSGSLTHVGFPLLTSVSPPTFYPYSLQLSLSPLSPSPVTTLPSFQPQHCVACAIATLPVPQAPPCPLVDELASGLACPAWGWWASPQQPPVVAQAVAPMRTLEAVGMPLGPPSLVARAGEGVKGGGGQEMGVCTAHAQRPDPNQLPQQFQIRPGSRTCSPGNHCPPVCVIATVVCLINTIPNHALLWLCCVVLCCMPPVEAAPLPPLVQDLLWMPLNGLDDRRTLGQIPPQVRHHLLV
jgi:hypothetical protein